MYKTSDVAGLFKSITGGLKLDTDDPMMSLLNSKDCSSCQIGPYQSKSSSSIFSTFHYEYYRQISKKVSFESNQWDPVSALCSNLYSIPAMLRCEQVRAFDPIVNWPPEVRPSEDCELTRV